MMRRQRGGRALVLVLPRTCRERRAERDPIYMFTLGMQCGLEEGRKDARTLVDQLRRLVEAVDENRVADLIAEEHAAELGDEAEAWLHAEVVADETEEWLETIMRDNEEGL